MGEIISVENALHIVKTVSQQLLPVSVPIYEALGKVLAQDIHAPDPLPPYPASVKVIFFFSQFGFYDHFFWKFCFVNGCLW